MNNMRSEFNAYRWNARREWSNKKVIDLQRAEEFHDLGAIHRILRETGLSEEKTFSAKGREFCPTEDAIHIWNLVDKIKWRIWEFLQIVFLKFQQATNWIGFQMVRKSDQRLVK